jgi:hypothetical protein
MVTAVAVKASALPMLPFVVLDARRRRRAWVWTAVAGVATVTATALLFGWRAPGLGQAASQQESSNTLPWLASRALGYDHVPGSVHAVAMCALAGTVAALLWRTAKGADWITAAGWAAFTLLVTLSCISPYYLALLLPFAVLSRSRPLQLAAAGLGYFLLSFFHFQYAHL